MWHCLTQYETTHLPKHLIKSENEHIVCITILQGHLGSNQIHSEASVSRCCNNRKPGGACENVVYNKSIYVEERQLLDKMAEKNHS